MFRPTAQPSIEKTESVAARVKGTITPYALDFPINTGRQFDGLWHTSVVVYGQEYFFGGGIQEATPG